MTNKAGNARIGLNCALSTPFTESGAIDLRRLTAHATDLLKRGCSSVTLFGTTGEGASIGLAERYKALGAFEAAGIDMRTQVIVGVAAATVDDAVAQARAGYESNCRALLVAPPFYFGDASDEGLFRWFSSVFEKLGPALRDVFLYHIPGMTRNHISIELTQRLSKAFPGAIVGVKDSNGDWAATERRLKELPASRSSSATSGNWRAPCRTAAPARFAASPTTRPSCCARWRMRARPIRASTRWSTPSSNIPSCRR